MELYFVGLMMFLIFNVILLYAVNWMVYNEALSNKEIAV
jgi:NADH:ubiquinone oxidoreductase subunit 3 (subunit A)